LICQLLNRRPNVIGFTGWSHLPQDLVARHVRFLDLKSGCWSRNKTFGGRGLGKRYPNIDAVVPRILVAAPSNRGCWKAEGSQLGLAQTTNEAAKIIVSKISDVLRRDFEHGTLRKPTSASA
jgi:hypothetical protein